MLEETLFEELKIFTPGCFKNQRASRLYQVDGSIAGEGSMDHFGEQCSDQMSQDGRVKWPEKDRYPLFPYRGQEARKHKGGSADQQWEARRSVHAL